MNKKRYPSDEMQKYIDFYEDIIDLVGEANIPKLHKRLKGKSFRIPQRMYNLDYMAQYIRDHKELSYYELAEKFDYTQRHVRELEKYEKNPKLKSDKPRETAISIWLRK